MAQSQSPPPSQKQASPPAAEEHRFEVIRDAEGNTVVRDPEFSHPDHLWVPPSSAPGRPPPITMDKIDHDVTPSGEIVDSASVRPPSSKKKGTAAKKAPKKAKPKSKKKAPKSKRPPATTPASDEDESDNGPYCICRGPDDHRWMIGCEKCEDWFHGECVDLDMQTGETLVETFICPNCTDGRRFATRYRKMCSLPGCRKAARVYSARDSSVFCSDDHAHVWWDRMVAGLPRRNAVRPSAGDALTQEDFMALVTSELGGVDEATGTWKLAKHPFVREAGLQRQYTSREGEDVRNGDVPIGYLTEEEEVFVHASASDRYMLAEEIVQCKKMLQLLEMANDRHKAAVTAGRFTNDMCGYDGRLDSVSAQHSFAAWCKTDEATAIFKEGRLGDPAGREEDEDAVIRGMCERKRCKPHHGWYNMLTRAIRAQIKDLAAAAKEKLDQEADVKGAAEERFYRKVAEGNRVEVLDEGDEAVNGVNGNEMDVDGV